MLTQFLLVVALLTVCLMLASVSPVSELAAAEEGPSVTGPSAQPVHPLIETVPWADLEASAVDRTQDVQTPRLSVRSPRLRVSVSDSLVVEERCRAEVCEDRVADWDSLAGLDRSPVRTPRLQVAVR